MKKILALTLALMMLTLCFVACNNGTTDNEHEAPVYNNAAELINSVWDKMPELLNDGGTPDIAEDDLTKTSGFEGAANFVGGMTFDADGAPVQVNDKAGAFDMTDASIIDNMLGFPAAEIDKVDDVASLMFMMNQNTFTCSAYHVKDGVDAAALANAIEQNIQGRHWMCGFPEKVVVINVPGNYLIVVFGHTIVEDFVNQVTASIPDADVVINNPIR